MSKTQKEYPQVKIVKCKNCIKYKSETWVQCEGRKLHYETPRVCDIFVLKDK